MSGSSHQFPTSLGLLTVVPVGHGCVLFQLGDTTLFVDPYSEAADFSRFPKATMVFFTHDHYDHYDPEALKSIVTSKTLFVGPDCMEPHLPLFKTMAVGDTFTWNGMAVQAVEAYNIEHKKSDGSVFHPKGYGVGYIFIFGDLRIYVAGDTELIPEMHDLGPVDVAFLPKNLPYTMSDAMFVEAVKVVKAPIVYPYHYFEADRKALQKAVGKEVTLYFE